MKTNQKKELRQKSIAELKEQMQELELELASARLELTIQKLEDTSKPKRLAKDLATIKTIITEKQTEKKVS